MFRIRHRHSTPPTRLKRVSFYAQAALERGNFTHYVASVTDNEHTEPNWKWYFATTDYLHVNTARQPRLIGFIDVRLCILEHRAHVLRQRVQIVNAERARAFRRQRGHHFRRGAETGAPQPRGHAQRRATF